MGDPDRGYLLELLLTKLRYAAGLGHRDAPSSACAGTGSMATGATQAGSASAGGKGQRRGGSCSSSRSSSRLGSPCSGSGSGGANSSGKQEGEGLQIVGMSATMPNTGAIAKWLNVSEEAR